MAAKELKLIIRLAGIGDRINSRLRTIFRGRQSGAAAVAIEAAIPAFERHAPGQRRMHHQATIPSAKGHALNQLYRSIRTTQLSMTRSTPDLWDGATSDGLDQRNASMMGAGLRETAW